jgi:ribosomal protein S18 acetylase RimI-like enzyme
MTYTLVPFTPEQAETVAGWALSADEADMWCARAEHPVPARIVASWATRPDVTAYLLVNEGEPVAYGEVWADEKEQEAELGRLIVAPPERGRGVGRALTTALVAHAGYEDIFLRVRPDNAVALATYRRVGFDDVPPELQAEWNAPQPRPYAWLQYYGPVPAARS